MQDHRPSGSQDPATPLLFFWQGDEEIGSGLALWLGAQAVEFDPVGLTHALRQGRQAVVLWRGPEGRLGRCVATGQGVSRALDDWRVEARGLLVLFRQNRRRLVLLDAGGLDRGGIAALAGHLGRPEPQDPLATAATSPLGLVLARLAQHGDPDLRQLVDELHAASLPCGDLPLPEAMDDAVAEIAAMDRARLTLQGQVESLTRQQQADAAHAAGLATQISEQAAEILTLHTSLTGVDQARQSAEAARANALAELDLLRQQVELTRDALTRQIEDLQDQIAAATLLVQTKDSLILTQEAVQAGQLAQNAALSSELADLHLAFATTTEDLARVRAQQADLTDALATREAEAALLKTQIDLAGLALAQMDEQSKSAADLALLRIKALEEQTATQDLVATELAHQVQALHDNLARKQAAMDQHLAEAADLQAALAGERAELANSRAQVESLTALLASHASDAGLLRSQINLSGAAMAHLDDVSVTASDVARLRIKVLEEQSGVQDLAAAELASQVQARTEELAQHQALVARLQADLAEQTAQNAALRSRATQTPSPATTGPSEADLLLTQLGLMQDLLASGSAPASPPAEASADPAPRTEAWDKALAKALAAARSEAEQRSRVERELRALKAEAQSRTRREEDTAHNRRLFAMMTSEANAALDEIARLSQARKAPGGHQDIAAD